MPILATADWFDREINFTSGRVNIPGRTISGIPRYESALSVPTPPERGSRTMSASSTLATSVPPARLTRCRIDEAM